MEQIKKDYYPKPHNSIYSIALPNNTPMRLHPVDEIKTKITDVKISNSSLSPNNDGINDVLSITVTLSNLLGADIVVENSAGAYIKTLTQTSAAGVYPLFWDGKDSNNNPVYNGIYYISANAWVEGQTGHVRFDHTKFTVTNSVDIVIPQPEQRVRPFFDGNNMLVGTMSGDPVTFYVSRNQSYPIISYIAEPYPMYEVKATEGVIGRLQVQSVEIINLNTIPEKWGRTAIAGVIVRLGPTELQLIKEQLPKNAIVRILRQDGSWYRVLLESGIQAYIRTVDLDVLPSTSVPITYSIISGDTLWKIAQKFNTTIDVIAKANNLNLSVPLMIGQKLIIPPKSTDTTPPSSNLYLVNVNAPDIGYIKLSTRKIAFDGNSVPAYLTVDMETKVPTKGYIDVIGSTTSTKINLSSDAYKTEHIVSWVPWDEAKNIPLAIGDYQLKLNLVKANGSSISSIDLGKLSVVTEAQPKPLIDNVYLPGQITPKMNPYSSLGYFKYRLNRAAQVQAVIKKDNREINITLMEYKAPGYYDIPWSGRDYQGNLLPNGTYTMEIRAIDPYYNNPVSKVYASQSLIIVNSDYRIPEERVRQLVNQITLNSSILSPNGDGIQNNITGTVTFNEKVRANVEIVNAMKLFVNNVLKSGEFEAGTYPFSWNGRMLAYNSLVNNGTYYVRVIIREDENKGEIVFLDKPITVTGSYSIPVPIPTQKVQVISDYANITSITNLGADYVGKKGEVYSIINFSTEYTESYEVELAENVIGVVKVFDVDIIDLNIIPQRWGKAIKDGVMVRPGPGDYYNSIQVLPRDAKVRILRTDGNWYRVILSNGRQAYIKTADLIDTSPPALPISTTYTIVSGDTLWKIAQRFGITLDALVSANNLNLSQHIYIGQKLSIPTKPIEGPKVIPQFVSIYTIKSGDTLSKIAMQYNITVNELAYANALNISQPLYIGQKLGIPKFHPASPPQTLQYIASIYYTTVQNMALLNNIDPNKPLTLGQRLMISL